MRSMLLGAPMVLMLACSGSKDDPVDKDTSEVPDGGLGELTIDVSTDPVGVATASISSGSAGVATVTFGLEGEESTRTSLPGESGTSHNRPMVGLVGGSTYEAVVSVELEDGTVVDSEPVTFDVPPPPQGVPLFTQATVDGASEACEGGYVLLSFLGLKSGVAIINRDGRVVWSHLNDNEDVLINRVRMGLDGRSVVWTEGDAIREDVDLSYLVRKDLITGETTRTKASSAHHDFIEHADGTLAWLGYDFRDVDIDGDNYPVCADTILEGPEGQTTDGGEEVFNVFDDYTPGIFYVGPDMNFDQFIPNYHEFSHGNSLMYRESDDSYFAMFRWLDALVKVDRATGEMVWQMGGADNEFTGDPATMFEYPHMSTLWTDEDGKTRMLVFDNRRGNQASQATEFVVDEDAMTYERVWVYADPNNRNENLLGDVVPMQECDNRLVAWSAQGRVTELTDDGQVAWEVGTALGLVVARLTHLTVDDLTF